MKITNENGEPFGVICGWRYDTDIIVTGDFVWLIFHSDYEVQKKGFNISFTAVPKPSEYNYFRENTHNKYRVLTLGCHPLAFSFFVLLKRVFTL